MNKKVWVLKQFTKTPPVSGEFFMKKSLTYIPILFLLIIALTGCSPVGAKNASLSVVYGFALISSLFLLLGYLFITKQKNIWYLVLFSSVFIVNIGYFYLACSASLNEALWANRIAYLGSVFLPLSMFMIILNATNTKFGNYLPYVLGSISIIIFLIAASPGYLDIYYKEVSFEIENGVAFLKKEYGVLHPIYLFYLVGYFAAMIAAISRAYFKKTTQSTSHAMIIAIAVFVNIAVWFIEQMVSIEFEMLSISYIISELFLLSIHHIVTENRQLKGIITTGDTSRLNSEHSDILTTQTDGSAVTQKNAAEIFINGLQGLTHTERLIYEAYISRATTKEIMAALNIKENTLKFHNKNIYSKLGVSSRKELLEIYKQINT